MLNKINNSLRIKPIYGIFINTLRAEGFTKSGVIFPRDRSMSIGWINNFSYHDQSAVYGAMTYTGIQKSYYSNLLYQWKPGLDNHTLDAGISYKDVDYINTHGTSTAENDSIETKAIKAVFKENAKNTPVSSVKSMLGHLIGAAGAAELITCILAIRDNIVPPTMNLNDPDPELDLDYVPNKPRKMPVNIVMNESFGFGGQNNVVIIKRYQE